MLLAYAQGGTKQFSADAFHIDIHAPHQVPLNLSMGGSCQELKFFPDGSINFPRLRAALYRLHDLGREGGARGNNKTCLTWQSSEDGTREVRGINTIHM